MTDPFELEDEEWVEICDADGKRSSMRRLAEVSFGGKNYHVLGAVRQDELGDEEHGSVLVREDQTVDGAQEYVITEDEEEIEHVVGHFVAQSIMKMVEHAVSLAENDGLCPCGMRHRPGEFCFCDHADYLQ